MKVKTVYMVIVLLIGIIVLATLSILHARLTDPEHWVGHAVFNFFALPFCIVMFALCALNDRYP